jgi:hypothetical protein
LRFRQFTDTLLVMSGSRRAASPVARTIATALRSNRGVMRGAWRVLRLTLAIGAAGLVAFHAALLWDRIAGGQLLDPSIALRWALAMALCAALAALRSQGVPLARGRRALVVWLLVAVLHWSSEAAQPAVASGPDLASVIFVVPTVAAAALLGAGLVVSAHRAASLTPRFAFLSTVGSLADPAACAAQYRASSTRGPPLQTV